MTATAVFAGLSTGAIYALIAIGYNITLTSSGVLNFAFANVLVFGGFVAISAVKAGLPLPLVLLLCALACAAMSVLVERAAIRFMSQGSHAELITTLGAGTIITAVTAVLWGSDPRRLTLFDQHPVDLLTGRVLPVNLILIAMPVVLGLVLHLLFQRTRFGLASRAQAFDREATMVRGVDVRWLSVSAFAIAGLFAGLTGPFVLMSTSAGPFLAVEFALKGFVALALGGLGSQLGAVVAGFVIGLVESLANLYIGSLVGNYAVFALFILVLLFRPNGLFGSRRLRLV
ncbi:branched-chain amino acid ABC transporter permease [Actinomadura sp. LD22]|uniref:Branched-chain amino acid ABC transporter permease n=1 Tax=Actinomadura physcomitrii TaxID=2650748 RepID=A0A6I4MQR9_9ACTN|nr:branched-chain amino acid ABC transporter permease [Actinomadura physcomitrii]MWA07360.1 branched-chain amino acid ABC transporter permease [Actinomadura physcomitrii]